MKLESFEKPLDDIKDESGEKKSLHEDNYKQSDSNDDLVRAESFRGILDEDDIPSADEIENAESVETLKDMKEKIIKFENNLNKNEKFNEEDFQKLNDEFGKKAEEMASKLDDIFDDDVEEKHL